MLDHKALLLEILDLPEDATDEQIQASADALEAEGADIQKNETEVANRLADLDLDKYANRIKPDAKPKWKEALVANRENAIALLEGLPEAPAATTPLHNRAGAATPAAGPADFPAAFQSEITAGKSRSEAVDLARTKYPELHQTWLKNGGAAHL